MQVENNSGKMKVCLIIHSLGIGGMERVMSELANNFSQRVNLEVHLILIGLKRNIEYNLNNSIHIHKPDFTFNNNRRTLDTCRTVFFIRSKVKEIDPNTVLGFGEMWNNLILLSLFKSSYPVFISDRSEPDKDLGRVHNYLRNILYPFAAGYIAQTVEAKRVCINQKWNKNIRVIGNPIRSIERIETIEKENVVLTVGRLIKTKHIDQLIRMFDEIGKPDWKLLIVGGDAKKMSLSDKLQKLIDDLGAGERISLEGKQKKVERYYNRSKIFAFTSSSEGFPNVVGEALSAGLPVVAYDNVAGNSDLIKDGDTGFLVPLFDEKNFASKLTLLIKNNQLREKMAKRAPDSIKKYSVNKISDKFFNFILSDT